jgi:hypothetical protein
MTQPPFHRNNHFVPCVYLKGWTGTDSKVFTYRLLVSHNNVPLWRSYSPASIAYHSHLYTQTISGVERDDFEKWLGGEFEARAEEPLRKARSGTRLTRAELRRLVRFLAAQDVRTPAWFMQQATRLDEYLPRLMETTLKESLRKAEEARTSGQAIAIQSLSPAEREGLPLQVIVNRNPEGGGEIGVEMLRGRQLWLWSIKRHLTNNISALLQHHWTILRPAKGLSWFTSDNPVVRLNYKGPTNYDFLGGWGSPGTQIFLPLDPKHLLFTHIGERPRRHGDSMTREETVRIRRFIAEHAWRMVFAPLPDHEMPGLRPRSVDADEFQRERDEWARWHQQQTAAEQEFKITNVSEGSKEGSNRS